MKKYTIILFIFLPICLIATPIKESKQAYKLVEQSIKKYNLNYMPEGCYFHNMNENNQYYEFHFYEIHNDKCGGDPQTSPRMFSYMVEKNTGKLFTTARLPYQEDWDGSYHIVN